MNILLLEDNGSVFSFLIEKLEKHGHKIELATKVSRAMDLMEKFDNKFDCLIVDLHVNPIGLDIENIDKNENIWGWRWLEKYVFPKDEKWKKKTIIYSGYTQKLYLKVDKRDYEDVFIIKKNSGIDNSVDDIDLICTYLKKIEISAKIII